MTRALMCELLPWLRLKRDWDRRRSSRDSRARGGGRVARRSQRRQHLSTLVVEVAVPIAVEGAEVAVAVGIAVSEAEVAVAVQVAVGETEVGIAVPVAVGDAGVEVAVE